MTDPATPETPDASAWPAVPGDTRRLLSHLSAQTEGMVRRVSDVILQGLYPQLDTLPAEYDTDSIPMLRSEVRLFIKTLDEARAPEPGELEPVRSSVSKRATEGVPLRIPLWCHHLVARVIWETACELAPPLEPEQLHAVGDRLHRFMSYVAEALSIGRAEGLYSEGRPGSEAFTSALIEGAPAAALAAQLGFVLDNRYRVISFHLGENTEEREVDDRYRLQSGLRKARRVRARLARLLGRSPLVEVNPTDGVVLIPERQGDVLAQCRGPWTDELAEAIGAPVWGVVAPLVPVTEIPQVVTANREMADVLVAMGLPAGAYAAEDLVLERMLWRASADSADVARIAASIADQPDLTDTIAAYVEHNGDRRATASALYVHPNTVDNRLARIATLTGLDPRTSRGMIRLHLALTMGRLQAAREA
ncbi:PucR family transcriptional regulator [Saccharopolyspora shandongensis]|uniref:PucR family transcriptional regulator n=1 Tax=Saccharopolyspora shandongensis TaxID=418495 RepID=UPI0033DE8244